MTLIPEHPLPSSHHPLHPTSGGMQRPTAVDATERLGSLNLHESASPLPRLSVPTTVPNSSQAICHLKLLNAFAKLRVEISSIDGLFGINDCGNSSPNATPNDSMCRQRTMLQGEIREKRWAVFVARAADRFECWWQAIRKEMHAHHLTFADMKTDGFGREPLHKVSFNKGWMRGKLPPLDVLMVWHSFMLNPRAYLDDCLRQGVMLLWHHGMPWAALDAAIDSDTGDYQTGKQAIVYWESNTGKPWRNLDESPHKIVACPRCRINGDHSSLHVEWTSTGPLFAALAAQLPYDQHFDDAEWKKHCHKMVQGEGFADAGLVQRCPQCSLKVDHDHLRAGRFFRDSFALRPSSLQDTTLGVASDSFLPLSGTILNHKGNPAKAKSLVERQGNEALFPNRLIQAMVTVGPWTSNRIQHTSNFAIKDIKKDIETALKDYNLICYTIEGLRPWSRLLREERISIRRMMSCYWDNSSPFAIDLVAAVIRQGSFIEKMQGIDWLHSPARAITMDRLLVKYQRFFHIMGAYPRQMAVPTLDVDLAWHTHQLSPQSYYLYSLRQCKGVFIDHDDKVPEVRLSTSFAETSKVYQDLYGEPYSQCICWYCEATRFTYTTHATRFFHRSTVKQVEAELYSPSSSEHDGVHISAHNSIRPSVLGGYKRHVSAHQEDLRKAYQKACKRAIKQGRQPPQFSHETTNEKSSRGVSSDITAGYFAPVLLPYGAPECVDSGAYVCNPSCANAVAGGPGNCATGSCGGLVAAGACGSGSVGALCAGTAGGAGAVGGIGGGSTGGCGGGGGVGGCGGGGGGGGGGCGSGGG